MPSFGEGITPASLNTPADSRASLLVPHQASGWTAFSVAMHVVVQGCSPHRADCQKRWSSECTLLVSVSTVQMSVMIPRASESTEAKMTLLCTPWNRPKVASSSSIGY